MAEKRKDRYPPIRDYAFLSDCHSAALVSSAGSIDWCCMPRMDSASVFGRLLDWDNGGYCEIVPTDHGFEASREYIGDSLVLATTFQAHGGEIRVVDCFTMTRGGAERPRRQLLRAIEGVRGSVECRIRVVPRFDYAGVRPWLRRHGERLFTVVGGNDALVVSSDADLEEVDRHDLETVVVVGPNTRTQLSMTWMPPEHVDPRPPEAASQGELDERLQETLRWWEEWGARAHGDGASEPAVRRSAVVLKGLMNAPTGAVAAAPTTSLPEAVGAERNWDYRYSWIRDSQFTVRSLGELGREAEADGFRRFIERSSAGSAESLQIMYGLGGERRLTELELDHLEGYRRSHPVRVGNAASEQVQLDVYGYLLDLAWRWHRRGRSPDDDYWRFLVSLVDTAADNADLADRGIWEVRGEPQHLVHSKVMCWAALDRGLKLAEECMRRAPTRRWKKARDAIGRSVETKGYDDRRGVFVQAYGSEKLDAALLLLPAFDFVAYDDERMVRTTDAICEELDDGGLLRRYLHDDGLGGTEGVFIACTFWLAECLAHQGRRAEALDAFNRAAATGNDLGLFSEEYDPKRRELLGNFPQGLTHLSHIAAAVALERSKDSTSS